MWCRLDEQVYCSGMHFASFILRDVNLPFYELYKLSISIRIINENTGAGP